MQRIAPDQPRPSARGDMRAYLERTRQLPITEASVDAVLWETGWLLGYALRGPVALLDPDAIVFRLALGPEAARKSVLDGISANLSTAIPQGRPDLKLGLPYEHGGAEMAGAGAAIWNVERFVARRVELRAERLDVPNAVEVSAQRGPPGERQST